ncbi:protein bicaudal C homolog 1-B isoform X4 [Oryzias latipes]|uniref:Bicaudal C homolog 2 n=1 Tax=Oryzias latipes TaxID=8090 RepID=H2LHI2_ORYLA|nr:protein bicaudal C homolog 1-B isoform X2 [Oryzias latipes]XP_023814953.1 protein bicaudal C homolog 1-B isoform X4 [Oryzias latipes]
MATTTTEETSGVSQDTIAPQQPELGSNIEHDSAAKPDPKGAQHDKKEKEEAENGGASSAVQKDTTRPTLDPEWVEERFRIDRKKLESMLYAPKSEDRETGEEFFERVMRETNTQVKWPSKLKIGAKSKKDPHVKVEGKPAGVIEAKMKILEVLETKVNKVTLKMDVAYTEHSHVIGKGGGNIKKVMDATSCHIHFPDSNRHNSAGEKSNQVSIAGPIDGVEDARRRIRDLQPLSLTFDLPVSLVPQALPDAGSPLIQQVVQAFGVSVNFRALPLQPQTQTSFYGNCCTVWGLQGNTAALKEATCILMDLLLGSEVPGGAVSSQLDVTTQQHLFLLGQNGTHFLSIMQQTQTQIILPDLSAPQSPPSLLIQGSPDGVCLARQQLMDCLPVCLMFDMREDGAADPCMLAKMMQNLGVFISVKPKVKQTSKSVVVKGLERNISNIYEARRALLGLDSSEHAKINGVSHDPVLPGGGVTNYWLNMLLQQLRLSEQGSLPVSSTEIGSGGKPRLSPPPGLAPSPEECRSGLRGTDNRPLEKILENEYQSGQSEDEDPEMSDAANGISRVGLNGRRRSLQTPDVNKVLSQGRRHSTGQAISYRLLNPETKGGRAERRNSLRSDVTLPPNVCADSSKDEDYDYEKKKLLATRAMQRKPVVTEVRTPTDTWSGLGFSKSMPAEAVKELRTINRRSYKPYLSTTNNNQQQSWAAQTGKACNGSNSENWRDRRGSTSRIVSSSPSSPISPPATLSSSTSSFPSFASSMSTNRSDTPPEGFVSSSFFESSSRRTLTCSQQSPSPSVTDDLHELLNQLGLIKYIDVFEQQEIDYQTFLTLSDDDLKEVGVSTFGARRKMLLAISDLNKSKRRLSDAPAVKSGYLEGGASGRLPRIIDVDVAAQRNGW